MAPTETSEFDAARHRAAQTLFDELVELPAEQRAQRLEHACAEDPALLELVQRYLNADAAESDFDTDDEGLAPKFFARQLQHADLPGALAELDPGPPMPTPGQRVGRHIVLSSAGTGGMGHVLVAYDPELDRRVALKFLHTASDHPHARARLQREARAMARLSHPNVVAIYDVGTFEERTFIAMEYVDGVTLHEWMASPREVHEVIALFERAGRGLQAAHDAGLVHRDFKPANVLVTGAGEVKVTDFGIVRSMLEPDTTERSTPDPTPGVELADAPRLTSEGALVGTPAYMAPEQFTGVEVDARADQFAFCVVLYQALWGTEPFSDATTEAFRDRVLEGRAVPPPRKRGVPSWLGPIVMRGLARDPNERWASMQALLEALSDDPRHRRRRWIAVAMGLALLAGVGVAAGFEQRQERKACAAAAGVITDDWNPEIATRVRRAIVATELAFAERTATRVNVELDTWVARWQAARLASCSASEGSSPMRATQARCLDRQRERLAAQVSVLHDVDRTSVAYVLESIYKLPDAGQCEDPVRLASFVDETDRADPVAQALRTRIAQARLLHWGGRSSEALNEAQAILADPELERFEGLKVEAQLVTSAVHGQRDDPDAHIELARAAYFGAGRSGDDELALRASLALATAAVRAHERELARLWADQADTLVVRLGERARDRALHHEVAARLALIERDAEAAVRESRASLRLFEQVHGGPHPDQILPLARLASIARRGGELEQASELFARAEELGKETLGPTHPTVLLIRTDVALIAREGGNYFEALELLEGCVADAEQALGPTHRVLEKALSDLASLQAVLGHRTAAAASTGRVLDICVGRHGVDHPETARMRANYANDLSYIGRHDEAHAQWALAMPVLETSLGLDDPILAGQRLRLADLLIRAEDYDAAARTIEMAMAVLEAKPEFNEVGREWGESLRSKLDCQVGKAEVGAERLRRLLDQIRETRGPEDSAHIDFRLELARCELARGESARALEATVGLMARAESSLAPDTLELSDIRRQLGELELAAGQRDSGLSKLEDAFAVIANNEAASPVTRVEIRLSLAEALADSDPKRAQGLLDEARQMIEDPELSLTLAPSLEARLAG